MDTVSLKTLHDSNRMGIPLNSTALMFFRLFFLWHRIIKEINSFLDSE